MDVPSGAQHQTAVDLRKRGLTAVFVSCVAPGPPTTSCNRRRPWPVAPARPSGTDLFAPLTFLPFDSPDDARGPARVWNLDHPLVAWIVQQAPLLALELPARSSYPAVCVGPDSRAPRSPPAVSCRPRSRPCVRDAQSRTQNSLPSGSASTVHLCSAPRHRVGGLGSVGQP